MNPPDHTRLRRLVSSTFTARRVQALRPAIEAIVDDLLDRMAGEVDFIDAFAFPLPVNVIGELLGVPEPDRAQFQTLIRDWSQVLEIITPEVLAVADPAAATVPRISRRTGLATPAGTGPRFDQRAGRGRGGRRPAHRG
jgi:cytochrome P450